MPAPKIIPATTTIIPASPVPLAPLPAPVMAQSPSPAANSFHGPPPAFSSLFKPIGDLTTHPRLAISLDALDKCGKSHWALFTAPDSGSGIAVVMTDEGTAFVVKKAQSAGRRIAGVLDLLYPDPETVGKSNANAALQQEWMRQWQIFKQGMRAIAADKTISTVVRDTESEIWQLCQLAYFGRLTQIPQHLRTECNADYLSTFRTLYARPDLHIILVHKAKKEYKPNTKGEMDWTGGYERDGMNKIGFNVDLSLRAGWDGTRKCFYTHMPQEQASRFGGHLAGKYWYGEESGFGYLGIECFPETVDTPEVWGL